MEGYKINFVKEFGLKEFSDLAVARIQETGCYKQTTKKLTAQIDEDAFYTVKNYCNVATHC